MKKLSCDIYLRYLEELRKLEGVLKEIYDEMPTDAMSVRLSIPAHDLRLILMAFAFVPSKAEIESEKNSKEKLSELSYIIHRANENEVGYARVNVELLESVCEMAHKYLADKTE